jgi:hypothetical protein
VLQETKQLRQIDKIVFNQDHVSTFLLMTMQSHYAILWSEGGFSKFDVSAISVIQKVRNIPVQVEIDSSREFLPAQPRQPILVYNSSTEQKKSTGKQKKQIDRIAIFEEQILHENLERRVHDWFLQEA